MKEKEIYLEGGCYWGVEKYVSQIKGVTSTRVGFANGNTIAPTYEQVNCQCRLATVAFTHNRIFAALME